MLDLIIEKFGDYGAESSRRDEFQKHYAAFWCIEMLLDPTISAVICEYGEDVVVVRNNAYELHQVKTHQESRDDWKLEDVIPIISKTFAMVPYFGNVSRCCFVSNDKSTGILYRLKCLLEKEQCDWNTDDTIFFNDFCKNNSSKILKYMQAEDDRNTYSTDNVRALLLILDIDTDFHHMEYIQDSNMRKLRKAIEEKSKNIITLSDTEIAEIYERIMGMVGKATIGKTKSEKTFTRDDIQNCLNVQIKRRIEYRLPTPDEINNAPGNTKLEQKLQLGGFTPEFISNAREVYVATLYKARSWEFGDTTSILDDIKFRMKYIWSDSFDKICQGHPDQERIGRLILEEIKKDIPSLINLYEHGNFPVDDLFLLGTTWLLTSECQAYWSRYKIT
jgi:hypothetical protein